jgi:hypothetical protein
VGTNVLGSDEEHAVFEHEIDDDVGTRLHRGRCIVLAIVAPDRQARWKSATSDSSFPASGMCQSIDPKVF